MTLDTTQDTWDAVTLSPPESGDGREPDSLRREWDRQRAAATTGSERAEIDALFSRVMP